MLRNLADLEEVSGKLAAPIRSTGPGS